VEQLPDRHGDGGDVAAPRHVPLDSWGLRRSRGEGESRRSVGAAAAPRRTGAKSAHLRPLAGRPRTSADCQSHREPLSGRCTSEPAW
jgi:hypothetical protein